MNSPEVVKVRAIYTAAQQDMTNGRLGKSEVTLSEHLCDFPVHKRLWTDNSGMARVYEQEDGSDHTHVKSQRYYDENGRVRFLFAISSSEYYPGGEKGRGVSEYQHRIYLNEHGEIVLKNTRVILDGNAHFISTDDFIEDLFVHPKVLFSKSCE